MRWPTYLSENYNQATHDDREAGTGCSDAFENVLEQRRRFRDWNLRRVLFTFTEVPYALVLVSAVRAAALDEVNLRRTKAYKRLDIPRVLNLPD